MGMKCYRLHFLSHGIGGQVASPLPHPLNELNIELKGKEKKIIKSSNNQQLSK